MAKVSFFLDTRRDADNGYPLKIRITHNKTNASRSTGVFLFKDQWDQTRQRIVRLNNADHLNAQLLQQKIRLQGKIDTLTERNRIAEMTASNIIAAAEGNSAAQESNNIDNSFGGWLSRYADECKKPKTAASFRYTYKTLLDYVHTYARKANTIFFDEIDYQFVFKFRIWMTKKGMTKNTRRVHETNIRTIFNHAIRCNFVEYSANPYIRMKKESYKKKKKVYLKLEYFHRLLMLDFSGVSGKEGLELARDAFLLSFYMQGASPVDLFTMEKPDENGWITYERTKMENRDPIQIEIWLPKEARIIINKYKGKNTLLNWSEKYANWDSCYSFIRHRLDRIGSMIGVPDLTWYWARYTWSTYAQKTSKITGANDFAIDTMMGHTPDTLTGKVYASFEREDGITINREVIRYATSGVHMRCVPAPKFIVKRGTQEIVNIWEKEAPTVSQQINDDETVGTEESYVFNTMQNYYNFSISPNYIYQIM